MRIGRYSCDRKLSSGLSQVVDGIVCLPAGGHFGAYSQCRDGVIDVGWRAGFYKADACYEDSRARWIF
jgi:hypothetical protein